MNYLPRHHLCLSDETTVPACRLFPGTEACDRAAAAVQQGRAYRLARAAHLPRRVRFELATWYRADYDPTTPEYRWAHLPHHRLAQAALVAAVVDYNERLIIHAQQPDLFAEVPS